MSNGDHDYKHMVVVSVQGDVICVTDSGQPAVYHDAAPAELLCAQLRERNPGYCYRVLSFQVL